MELHMDASEMLATTDMLMDAIRADLAHLGTDRAAKIVADATNAADSVRVMVEAGTVPTMANDAFFGLVALAERATMVGTGQAA